MGRFQALGAGTPSWATNPSTGGRPAQRLAGYIPRTRRPLVIFNLSGDALEVVLVRRWLPCSVVWVAGTPFHRRARHSVLSRVFAGSLAS